MKTMELLLAGICAISLCTLEAQAFSPQQIPTILNKDDDHIPSGAERIRLKGKLNFNTNPENIEAGATENAVYLYFDQNYGNVNIWLYNPTGILIYSGVVDTSMQQLVVIPITSAASGTYTVVLDNANGYAEGDFEHD